MSTAELELVRDGVVVRVIPIGGTPVHFGRDLNNTVVLLDDEVSASHAVVGATAGGLELRDLRSTNGTFLNGARIDGRVDLTNGDEIAFGSTVLLRVRIAEDTARSTLTLEDLTAGTAYLVDDERYRIGSGPDCHLRLPDGPALGAVILVHPGGDVWIGDSDGDSRPLEDGAKFDVGGHTFQLVAVRRGASSTVWGCREARYAYELRAALTGPAGPTATLTDPRSGRAHVVTAENRATLLFVLAQRLLADRAEGRPEAEAGWQHDEDVLVAVWGRAGLRQGGSNYSVLLHRLRKEIEEAGFDPWFIEKRRGASRLRLATIELDEGA